MNLHLTHTDMKNNQRPNPSAAEIARALANSATPAAALAAWQDKNILRRLQDIRARVATPYLSETFAGARDLLARRSELSDVGVADNGTPLVWLHPDSVEIAWCWTGRQFLQHNGWYCDDLQEETYEGCAVVLARFPRLVFEAIRMGDFVNGEWRIDLSTGAPIPAGRADSYDLCVRAAARDAVCASDSSAERMAEGERDYQTSWRARQHAEERQEEARVTLKETRTTLRSLLSELRAIRKTAAVDNAPTACALLRAQVSLLLGQRSTAHETLAEELPEDPGACLV